MKYCVYCGHEINLNDNRCSYCGEDLSDTATNKIYHSNIKCIKCGSSNVDYEISKKNKNNIIYEEEIYTCNECGRTFTDKNRLGPSFNNTFQVNINVGPRMKKFLTFLMIVGIVVGVWYYHHLKGLKNENGTYYPYSIVNNVETTKDIFKVGEEFYCEDKSFVVNSVSYPGTVAGKIPSSGKKFITINFTVRNTADEPKLRSASDLEILLSNDDKVSSRVHTEFTSDRIESGASASGSATFEIPSSETNPVLRYYCDYWIDELIANVDLR